MEYCTPGDICVLMYEVLSVGSLADESDGNGQSANSFSTLTSWVASRNMAESSINIYPSNEPTCTPISRRGLSNDFYCVVVPKRPIPLNPSNHAGAGLAQHRSSIADTQTAPTRACTCCMLHAAGGGWV